MSEQSSDTAILEMNQDQIVYEAADAPSALLTGTRVAGRTGAGTRVKYT